jgi:L-histidine Nalpha-methyltransferase
MSTQPSVVPATMAEQVKQFATDVEYYLSQQPRQLPSRYFYDALGSALFEAICRLPWYGITRAELRLIERHGRAILRHLDPLARLVELGPGNGGKLLTLLETWSTALQRLEVHLVDVSPAALAEASRALSTLPDVHVITHEASYEAGLADVMRDRAPLGRTLAVFLGSNIGNFDRPGADAFLREIGVRLAEGDALLVGADLVKPEPQLLAAYADPLGLTAAFDRNLLLRVNRELGGDFDLAEFGHRAVWNAEESRVEMHLVSRRRQRVRIDAAGLDITLEAGEAIWTESSYKYEASDIVAALERAGFALIEQWIDREDQFALTLVQAV